MRAGVGQANYTSSSSADLKESSLVYSQCSQGGTLLTLVLEKGEDNKESEAT